MQAIIMTYRSVDGFNFGQHQGRLRNILITRDYSIDGPQWLSVWSRPNDLEQVLIYVGSRGYDSARKLATLLRENDKPLTIIACDCRDNEKRQLAHETKAKLEWCECGGEYTLGELTKKLLEEK